MSYIRASDQKHERYDTQENERGLPHRACELIAQWD
jgi:hypothetical protein